MCLLSPITVCSERARAHLVCLHTRVHRWFVVALSIFFWQFARLGLTAEGASRGGVGGLYNPLDAMWRDARTGGTIYVGNQQAAQNAALLKERGITHVVNCTDNMPLYHPNTFTYYRFNVSYWPSFGDLNELTRFLQPLWEFVDGCLAKGENVLVHCLAGAHRAGTTGILCLMRYAGMSSLEAIPTAKRLRPVIDPIGRFPELLRRYDTIRDKEGREARAAAPPPATAQPS